ncbi:phosphoribosyl-ATP pyrophosphohydrolase [Paenibacillus sp. IHB B 3415]|nr:phosphoribosyl-ATP pyrophosphohydrolase [Paenibacillus sp. IHB B 3415]
MKLADYPKLVRDGIPALIAANGQTCRTRIMDEEEYIRELRAKLHEELAEYLREDNDGQALEELADLLEVIRALAVTHGGDSGILEQIRAEKAERRGGFKERILLLQVESRG